MIWSRILNLLACVVTQVLGKLLVGEIFGLQLMCCRLKGQDAMTKFMIVLNSAMDGQDTERFPFSFFDRQGRHADTLLTVNKRTDAEGSITGVFCFLHTTSVELSQVRLQILLGFSLIGCNDVIPREMCVDEQL